MSDSKRNDEIEERLAALELYVQSLRGDLQSVRAVIESEHAHFIHLNAGQDRLTSVIIDRLELIEDRLEPAFTKAFPDYGRALDEIDAILDAPRKR